MVEGCTTGPVREVLHLKLGHEKKKRKNLKAGLKTWDPQMYYFYCINVKEKAQGTFCME